MSKYLGIDTSNYTTSAAIYDSNTDKMIMSKMLLPVKDGEKGIRQSDAVFHHTKQLPQVFASLFGNGAEDITAIGVSARPRNADGSYMPSFLCGESAADIIGSVNGIDVYKTSHQTGHVLSALYSSENTLLIYKRFIAFHVSGGTTEALLCEPDKDCLLKFTCIGGTLDLNAGQAVDRVGLMLGLKFPCGKELEKLAALSTKTYNIKPCVKENGCSFSGLENLCSKMLSDSEQPCDVARFCLDYIYSALRMLTVNFLGNYGNLPLIYAGGVMSNKYIRAKIQSEFDAYFAEPDYSCDNAAGTALYSYFKSR